MVVKLGIIGLGTAGKQRLRHCIQLPNAEPIAVADTSSSALQHARNCGIKNTYKSFDEMLSKEVLDAVVISLPHFLHCPVAERCADAGKHILLEKPLASTLDEGKRIIDVARRNNVTVMVNYNMRFNSRINYLKKMVDEGRIGLVRTMIAEFVGGGPHAHTLKPVPDWWFHAEKIGGGALIDSGSHMVDLSIYFFGSKPSVLYSCIRSKLHLPMEDEAILVLEFDAGTKALIHVGWFSQQERQDIILSGTVRTASLTDFLYCTKGYGEAIKNVGRKLKGKRVVHLFESEHSAFKALEHFVNCVQYNKRPSITGNDALEELKIIFKAYEISKHSKTGVSTP